MTCDGARLLFSARADDALAPDEAAQLAAHLEECQECRAEWARFERTVSLMRAIEPARAPAGFVNRVLERARPVPWHRRMAARLFLPVRIKLPIEAAAVVLVAGLAVLIFQRSPEIRQAVHPEPAPPFVAKESPAAPVPPPPRLPGAAPVEGSRAPAQNAPAPTPDRSLDDAARKPAASKESKAQPPAPELRAKVAEERTADRAERDSSATTPPVPPAAPAAPRAPVTLPPAARETSPSARPDAAAKPAPPQRSETLQRGAGLAAPTVRARLVAPDPAAAVVALVEAVSRAGGSEVGRRAEADGVVVDANIPGGAYAEFVRDLHRLGNVTIEQPPGESSRLVGVTIRITR